MANQDLSTNPPRPKRSRSRIELIGEIGVDAGLVYIGDPCYVIGTELGAMNWDQFVDEHKIIEDPAKLAHQIDQLTAVVAQSGGGDGIYPVYARIRDGRILSIMIDLNPHDL
jgi:hypothetical protein